MYYGNIKYNDISNGAGVRTSLFVSGCTHHCKGCFNEMTWDFRYGKIFGKEEKDSILKSMEQPYVQGLTLLGGEPMEPENQAVVLNLIKEVKLRYPEKDVWIYTGYTWEEMTSEDSKSRCKTECLDEILKNADIVVDGRFVMELKDISLRFKGSSNQRIIDIQESLKQNRLVMSSYNKKRTMN